MSGLCGLIDTSSGDLIAAGFMTFTAKPGTTVVSDVPIPSYIKGMFGGDRYHKWDGNNWLVIDIVDPLPEVLDQLKTNAYIHRDPSSWPGSEQLYRQIPPAYPDGFSAPSGASRPNPRAISNAIFDTTSVGIPNTESCTDMFWIFGQFIDHDIDLSPGHSPAEALPISIPTGDPDFDPGSTGTVTLP